MCTPGEDVDTSGSTADDDVPAVDACLLTSCESVSRLLFVCLGTSTSLSFRKFLYEMLRNPDINNKYYERSTPDHAVRTICVR